MHKLILNESDKQNGNENFIVADKIDDGLFSYICKRLTIAKGKSVKLFNLFIFLVLFFPVVVGQNDTLIACGTVQYKRANPQFHGSIIHLLSFGKLLRLIINRQ